MYIINNQTFAKVDIKLSGEHIVILPKDRILLDNDPAAEALQNVQPQLEFFKVNAKDEEKVTEEFKAKAKVDAEARKAEEERVARNIKEMEEQRAKMLSAKQLKWKKIEEANDPKPLKVAGKKVVAKVPAKIKNLKKKHEKK